MIEVLRRQETEIPKFSELPVLIQGGMGVGVSNWELARSVALAGEKLDKKVLGVVSGTGLPILMVDRLQKGDSNTIRALNAFPIPEITKEIFDIYANSKKMPPKPQVLITGTEKIKRLMTNLLMVSNFVEVWLAKEGHNKPIGVNYLEKVQMTHLPEIYGAMLAGVDYMLMGAGIPNQVPDVLDKFKDNQSATYKIDVEDSAERLEMSFDPSAFIPEAKQKELKRPKFLAIISSHVLAQVLANKDKVKGVVDGFIVEGPTAGGHNAPARGKKIDEITGEPIYGPKDEADLKKIQELGLPFWVAGDQGSPEQLRKAIENGAVGVQIGSAFASCEESGFDPNIKSQLRRGSFNGSLDVFTSPIASPTGFPFNVAQLSRTLSDPEVYAEKPRLCPYGYLDILAMYKERLVFRCSAEPDADFERKGGNPEKTKGRQCLCAGLAAAVNHGKDGAPMIVTFGKKYGFARELMKTLTDTFTAEDVVKYMLRDNLNPISREVINEETKDLAA